MAEKSIEVAEVREGQDVGLGRRWNVVGLGHEVPFPNYIDALSEANRRNAERVRELASRVERFRAERNRRVEIAELGRVSEGLEADNFASDASTVRSAMHELEIFRGSFEKLAIALGMDPGCEPSLILSRLVEQLDARKAKP